jgi:DNA-binding PucR family transcriptional regulator
MLTALATTVPDSTLREQLSNLRSLLMLSILMMESRDEEQILHLASTCVPAIASCHFRAITVDGRTLSEPARSKGGASADLEAQIASLDNPGGPVHFEGDEWAWAYGLGGLSRSGFLVVGGDAEPPDHETFLLRVLAQQTGAALASARLHLQEHDTAEQLATLNSELETTVQALKRSMDIHKRLTQATLDGKGQEGIAKAIFELTSYPVAVEDRYGNLRAWAGPNRPEPYPKDPPAKREQLLRRLFRDPRAMRDGGRLLALARARGDLLGVLVLIDPSGTAGEHELVALEHGATVLAMELAHLRSVAESELRLRRDLVEALLSGTEEESVLAYAQGLGYDLQRPHWVIVAEGRGRTRDDEFFFHSIRRAARELSVGELIVSRKGAIVILANRQVDWEEFRQTILRELGGGRCRLGIGAQGGKPADFVRSYREALLALKMLRSYSHDDRSLSFDASGVYRLLCGVEDLAHVDGFVREWLGKLIDYDTQKGSDLVKTLSHYLEYGGSCDSAAGTLFVHRSTVKYRLQRVREITGFDLNDPNVRFNLQLSTRAWQTLQALSASR